MSCQDLFSQRVGKPPQSQQAGFKLVGRVPSPLSSMLNQLVTGGVYVLWTHLILARLSPLGLFLSSVPDEFFRRFPSRERGGK